MAPKKKKTKSEESETKTEKKTAKKSEKKVKLTFSPIMGAASQFTALLRAKTIKEDFGREVASYSPAIEGLPMKLVVQKGETIEVTEAQFEELQRMGFVESDEEYKARQDFITNLSAQHPETLTWEMIVAEGSNFATLRDSQKIIYNDKLIRV